MMTQSTEDRILKIRKLLSMAEDRAASEAERDAFNAKATELMLQWGIEDALIQQASATKTDKIITKLFHVDVPQSFSHEFAMIGIQVANALGAKGLFQRVGNRTVTMVVGFESDLFRIELLIQSLVQQATLAQKTWWARNKYDYETPTERYNAKRSFIRGFADGVKLKLRAVYKQTVAAAGHGAELVLFDRTKQVAQWMNENLHTRQSRGRNYQRDAHGDGHVAGQRADVGQRSVDASGRAIGR